LRSSNRRFAPGIMLMPAIIILFSIGIFPFVYTIWLSMHSYSLLDVARGIKFVGGENFVNIMLNRSQIVGISFIQSMCITLIFAGSSLALEVILGLGLAVLFSKSFKSFSRIIEFFRLLLMIPMLLAPVVVGNIWRYIFQYSFGIFNFVLRTMRLPEPRWLGSPSWAMVALIIADVWEWLPFSFLVLLAAILSIPQNQLEAASVDGADSRQQLRYIILPGIKKALIVILLIRGIELIKTFDLVYILTSGGPNVATSVLSFTAFRLGFQYFEIGEAAAYALLLVGLINIIVLFFVNVLRSE